MTVIDSVAIEARRPSILLPGGIGMGAFFTAAHLTGGSGTPAQVIQLSAAKVHGVAMDDADEIMWQVDPKSHLWMFDLSFDLWAQVLFTHNAAAADTGIIFIATVKGVADGLAISDAKVSPDAIITFPAKTVAAVASGIEKTSTQAFNLTTAEKDDFQTDELLQFSLELDDKGDASANEIFLVGMRIFGTFGAFTTATGRPERT